MRHMLLIYKYFSPFSRFPEQNLIPRDHFYTHMPTDYQLQHSKQDNHKSYSLMMRHHVFLSDYTTLYWIESILYNIHTSRQRRGLIEETNATEWSNNDSADGRITVPWTVTDQFPNEIKLTEIMKRISTDLGCLKLEFLIFFNEFILFFRSKHDTMIRF